MIKNCHVKKRAVCLCIAFGLFVFVVSSLFAQDVDLFNSANGEYKAGHYQEAIELYEQLLKTGHVSTTLFYNLGNAYAKTGELGKAVLNFERARRFRPRDSDIVSNLNYVEGLLDQHIEDKRSAALLGLKRVLELTSTTEAVVVSSFSYGFWIATYLLYLLMRRPRWLKRIVFVLFTVMILSSLILGIKFFILREENAVVIRKSAEVKYGPSNLDKTAFKLSPGILVFVDEDRGAWSRIELRDGAGGWISSDFIERIDKSLPQT